MRPVHQTRALAVCLTAGLSSVSQIAYTLPVFGWASNEKSLWQGSLPGQNNVVNQWPIYQFPGPANSIGVSAGVVPIDIRNGVGTSFILTSKGFVVGCGQAPTPLDGNNNPTNTVWVNGAPGDPMQWLGRLLSASDSGKPQFVFGPNGGNLKAIDMATGGKSRSYHQLALTPEGTAVAWGGIGVNGSVTDPARLACGVAGPSSWQPPKYVLQRQDSPALLSAIKGIAVSTWMSLGLSCDGTIVSWGWDQVTSGVGTNKYPFPNGGGAPMSFYSGSNSSLAKQIDAGWAHYAYIAADGSLWMWGRNLEGQCANAVSTSNVWPPQQVVFPSSPLQPPVRIKQISLGYTHTLALDSQGNIWAWGSNLNGECRPGLGGQLNAPTKVGLSPAYSVSAGVHNSYALAIGTAIGWGENDNHELDMAITKPGWPANSLFRLATTNPIQELEVGEPCLALIGLGIPHIFGGANAGTRPFLNATGTNVGVKRLCLTNSDCVGLSGSDQLGYGMPGIPKMSKVYAMGNGFVDIATYRDSTLLITPGGQLWFHGDDSQTNLVDGSTTNSGALVDVSEFGAMCVPIAVEINGGVATVLMDNGTVWTSGSISSPLYGCPNPNKNTPPASGTPCSTVWNQVMVSATQPLTEVIAISTNKDHSVALLSNGETKAWGLNGVGQCSSNTSLATCIYATSSPLKGMRAIAAGNKFTIGIRYDGTVWGHGANNSGQLGNGSNVSSPQPVQAGNVVAGEFSPLIAKEISAGDSLSYYLLPSGRLKASGSDSNDVFAPAGPTHHKNRPTFVGNSEFYRLAKTSRFNRIGAIIP